MRYARIILCLFLCLLILGESPQVQTAHNQSLSLRPVTNLMIHQSMQPLKINMGARTLWSDGGFTHDEMSAFARKTGYDSLFFADDPSLFGSFEGLADPGFEDVNSTGQLTKWQVGTLGFNNSVALAEAYHIGSPNATSYYLAKVKSGTHSLHLEIMNNSPAFGKASAFARAAFPEGYVFERSQIVPEHPLLLLDLMFSMSAFVDDLGLATSSFGPDVEYGGGPARQEFSWFYLQFNFTVGHYGPHVGDTLRVTLVYTDHRVDQKFLETHDFLNRTRSKVVLLGIPPLKQWFELSANVTDLARTLWNQTISEYWRLSGLEIGVRSRHEALASVYVDDVELKPSREPLYALDYFNSVIRRRVSTSNFTVYAGYSIESPLELTAYVYGTNFIDPSQSYNLTDPTVWRQLETEVSSRGGVLALGPTDSAYRDYIVANNAFNVKVLDGSTWSGVTALDILTGRGQPLLFTATRTIRSPRYFGTNQTWNIMAFAENKSEVAILNAIESGNTYLAIGNFKGTFTVTSPPFRMGASPVYVPIGENASLYVSLTGFSPGNLTIYSGNGYDRRVEDFNGNVSRSLSVPVRRTSTHVFLTAVTGNWPISDRLAIVSNPLTFIQVPLIPYGALFIDNDDWALTRSEWTTLLNQQSLDLTLDGPAISNATLYLFSPDYRPDAKSSDMVARWIRVGNKLIDPRSVYDTATSTFAIPLQSNGNQIAITFNFDIPMTTYVMGVISGVAVLYVIVIIPFVLAVFYTALRRLKKKAPKQGYGKSQ